MRLTPNNYTMNITETLEEFTKLWLDTFQEPTAEENDLRTTMGFVKSHAFLKTKLTEMLDSLDVEEMRCGADCYESCFGCGWDEAKQELKDHITQMKN